MNSRIRWLSLLAVLSASIAKQSLVFDLHALPRRTRIGRLSNSREEGLRHQDLATNLRSLRGRETHPLRVEDYANVEYHIVIEVGTPCQGAANTQTFKVVPDTGSADLWIPASNCTLCGLNGRYDAAKSCTTNWLGYRTHFKYGDGTKASGLAFTDVVKVGDLTIQNQTVVEVDQMSNNVGMLDADGVLGLAHYFDKSTRAHKPTTFMERLFAEHDMPHMFSFRLADQSTPSRLIFGDPQVHEYAKEPLIYGRRHYMTSSDLWLTSVYSVGFNSTGIERQFESMDVIGAPALVDSGTSLILLTPSIWDQLMPELAARLVNCTMHHIDGALMQCNCPPSGLLEVPTLVINLIDEKEVEHPLCMAAEEYITQSVNPITGMSLCVPSIQRGNDKQPFPLIFGMTFMRSFYTNFDVERHRIGFARSRLSPLPAHSVCSVHRPIEKKVWILSLAVIGLILSFAFYTCLCGDIRACCGKPSMKVSEPCIICSAESEYKPLCVISSTDDITSENIDEPRGTVTKLIEEVQLASSYRITDDVIVTKDVALDSKNIGMLSRGAVVSALELRTCGNRVRAKIPEPEGWISIEDTSTGCRWAEVKQDGNTVAAFRVLQK